MHFIGSFLDRMEQQPSGQFTNLAMEFVQVCNIYKNEENLRQEVNPIQAILEGLYLVGIDSFWGCANN